MVFSSLPAYLDPSNWHQQPQNNHQLIGTSSNSSSPNPRLTTPLPLPPPASAAQPHGCGSIRPGSMSERARMANIPMPETALKCPRCESTNTKFCYFNNYSLTQPRHFCKTCRRYWTRGGALRNVPVGGGCRRNKRSSKSSSSSSARSKSPASVDRQTNASTSAPPVHSNSGGGSFLGLPPPPPPPFPPLRFTSEHFTGDLGLNYGGIPATTEFPFGANLNHNFLQQFPILNGFDPSGLGLYQFHQGGDQLGFMESEARPKLSSSLLTQLAAVKMEENPAGMLQGGAMAPPLMASDHHWNGGTNAAWTTELSGFSSSSATSNHQLQ